MSDPRDRYSATADAAPPSPWTPARICSRGTVSGVRHDGIVPLMRG